MRDAATISQLAVLSNMEALNAELIKQGMTDLQQRKQILHKAAKEQMARFNTADVANKFSKLEHLGNPKYIK